MNDANLPGLYAPVAEELETVAETIRISLAPPDEGFGGPLGDYAGESVGYLLRSPGKLLRPVLVLCAGRLSGGPSAGVLTLAAAVELLHAASLAHDDVLDEEHVRRGARSLNREHGNQVAVLAGDVLYAKFFALLTRVGLSDPDRLSALFALFARTTERMCMAEICASRLRRSGRAASPAEYLRIIEYKTSDLMSACCRAAALVQGAPAAAADALAAFGRSFGIAFQLADDAADGDAPSGAPADILAEGRRHAADAVSALSGLPPGPHRGVLEGLCEKVAGGIDR